MKNKILLSIFSLALVFGVVGFTGTKTVHAQLAASFPVGCTSNLAYSVANGRPCNGTGVATMNVLGCSTALGYSVTNGVPCDGASVAIPFLAGCTSINGFSVISGANCDGTSGTVASNTTVAGATTTTVVTTTTPGLPVTGAGMNALLNLVLLFSLAIVAVISGLYLARKTNIAV